MVETFKDYGLVPDGGRVKSAGYPMDIVFQQAESFRQHPSPATAAEVGKGFQELRSNAPYNLRARVFPMEGKEYKSRVKSSPLLLRPILKTDQGAGKFVGFRTSETESLPLEFKIALEGGYVIPEAHFLRQLAERDNPPAVVSELMELRRQFAEQNMPEARQSYERLQQCSEQSGIIFNRTADVGRNGLFFIRPSQAESPIVLPKDVTSRVSRKANESIQALHELAKVKKSQFAREHNLPMREADPLSLPFYLQADAHILPSGEVRIAELQVPDVGLFLSGLDSDGNTILQGIQEVVAPIKERVADGFVHTIEKAREDRRDAPIYLVTRSEVIERDEDVLESRELAEIQKSLKERGYHTKVISAMQAAGLDEKSLLFLFNLDPKSEEFGKFAATYLGDTERKLTSIPDPFFRVAERDITGYDQKILSAQAFDNLHSLVREVEPFDKKDKSYMQLMAVDHLLEQQGLNEGVLHFYHPALPTPLPAYRYDVRGLHIAAHTIAEQGLTNVAVRSIPISPDRAILHDRDGGALYATFRFMFVSND